MRTARFLSALQVKRSERAEDKGAWVLTRELVYDSAVLNARVTVPEGFQTDFASVPRLPFVFLLYGGDVADEAAVVHDFLYQGAKVPRKLADAVFREAMAALYVPAWRRWPMWLGVRLFGGSHYG